MCNTVVCGRWRRCSLNWLRTLGTQSAVKTIQQCFGSVMKRRREAAGLSQEALAAAANLHRNYVGRLERGQMVPSLVVIQKIAAALGTTMAKFVAEVENVAD